MSSLQMVRQIIYLRQPAATDEATWMNSGTKPRRKLLTRAPLDREPRLTRRDVAILNAIADYDGFLTTVQLAMLFWPPSLAKKLHWWQLEPEMVEALLTQYPARHLDQRMELTKWLLKIQQEDPALFASLDPFLQSIARVEPKAWLRQAIDRDLNWPEAFLTRLRPASRWVSRACTSRLRFLYDAGYLEPEEQPTRLSEGRAPLLWFLSKQGRDFVAQIRKVAPKKLDWWPAGSFSASFLPHRIAISDFRIAVNLAATRQDFEIKMWLDDHELRQIHSQPAEKVSLTRPKDPDDPESEVVEQKVSIVPDGYFWLGTGKNFHQFVEVDLRTVTGQYSDPGLKDWARKVRAYSEYYKSGKYQLRYPAAGSSMRVLTVTTGERRLQNLKMITEKVIGPDNDSGLNRYWFCTFDKISPTYEDFFSETVLTGKIWHIAGREELHSLVW
ncbi:MAG: replication-relaxation family protein [Chloroflexota bacterium]